jgi:hypothetical protein
MIYESLFSELRAGSSTSEIASLRLSHAVVIYSLSHLVDTKSSYTVYVLVPLTPDSGSEDLSLADESLNQH